MTDRELLEAAAKAAGYKVHATLMEQRAIASPDAIALALSDPGNTWWNPLTDDGDALRLAVRLKLRIACNAQCARVRVPHGPQEGVMEPHTDDPNAATRRAIVRAAAAKAAG